MIAIRFTPPLSHARRGATVFVGPSRAAGRGEREAGAAGCLITLSRYNLFYAYANERTYMLMLGSLNAVIFALRWSGMLNEIYINTRVKDRPPRPQWAVGPDCEGG